MDAPLNQVNAGLLRFLLENTSEDAKGPSHLPQRTPEEMAWLRAALEAMQGESDAVRMKKLIDVLDGTVEDESPSKICFALEELIYLVEDMDNANDLSKLDSEGRAVKTVVRLLEHENPQVRHWAAWLVAVVAQNNPKGQTDLLTAGAWPVLLRLLRNEQDELVRNKVVGALSAMMSGENKITTGQFVESDGLAALGEFIARASSAPTRTRVLFLLRRLSLEFPELILPKLSEAELLAPAVASLLEDDADLREKAVQFLNVLTGHNAVRKPLIDLGVVAALDEAIRRINLDPEEVALLTSLRQHFDR